VDNQLISKAKDFVYRNKDALGRELLFSIPYNQTEREKKYFNMPVSGFKDRLIKNQGGWVYAHISGIAGATLIGNARVVAWMSQTGNQLIDKQMKEDRKELSDVEDMALLGLAYYDYYGTLRPLNEVLEEKRSEVADNEAGKQVGQILDDVMDRKISYEDARDKLFELLCDK
jgi:1,6-anhydro-N-acetylmuramate kinase